MDRGKKPTNSYGNKNCKIYLDLKDIVRENALRYLPAKSLFRCNGVCREWKLQISTPFFAHNQSNSFRSTSGFFYQSVLGVPSFVSVDPMAYGVPDPSLSFLPEPVDIRSSCNGLLCCRGRTGYKAYYVCNPVTKQWKKLPKPDGDHGPNPAVMLVFEPSLLNFIADYKLVCGFPSELDGYEFEVYSSQKGSWSSGDICFSIKKILPNSGVYVSGTVYWLSSQGITAFDLNSERSFLLYSTSGALGTMNGKLCAAHTHGQKLIVSMLSNIHSNTMQMSSNARTWVQLRPEIDLDITLPAESSTYSSHGYSGRHGQGNVVFVGGDIVLLRNGYEYYSYDLKKKASNYLGELNIDSNAAIVGYVNSLVEL